MKISITIRTENGYKKYEVDGYPAFEIYEHKFLAHRAAYIKDGRAIPVLRTWRVSDVETGGAIINRCFDNITEAIIYSKAFLENKGEKAFMEAVERAKKEVSRNET